MRTVRLKIYSFDELTKDVQAVVISTFYDINVGENWEQDIISNFKKEMKIIGFEVEEVKFRGFSSQGDGAMFTGSVSDFSQFYKNIDRRVIKLIEKGKITFSCTMSHYGRYTHERSMRLSFSYSFDSFKGENYPRIEDELSKMEESITTIYEEKARGLYKELEKEYDNLTSTEAIIETIKVNSYEFFKDGKIFYAMG